MSDSKSLTLSLPPPSWSIIGDLTLESSETLLLLQNEMLTGTPKFEAENIAIADKTLLNFQHQDSRTVSSHKRYLSYPLSTSESNVHQLEASSPKCFDKLRSKSTVGPLGIPNIFEFHLEEPAANTVNEAASSTSAAVNTPHCLNKNDLVEEESDLNGLGMPTEEPEEQEQGRVLTAAELRAQKRKMKRFRLTHNQTRYLMSEFARQAHPDAAHRDRLAREVPGLSSRQVQVWFQNRRAKLKRLTYDDREHVVRSRALPDNFDMTQALHFPFNATHVLASPSHPPANYAQQISTNSINRSPTIETLLQRRSSYVSSTCADTQLSHSSFTSLDCDSGLLSPVSPVLVHSPFSLDSPSFNSAASISSVLTPASPATGFASYCGMSPISERFCDFSNPEFSHHLDDRSPPVRPYGLGFTYTSIPGFSQSSIRNHPYYPGKVRIPRNTKQRGADVPRTSCQTTFLGSPLSSPTDFSMLSAPASITSFPNYVR